MRILQMKKRLYISLITLIGISTYSQAQSIENEEKPDIISHITADSINIIIQESGLENILLYEESKKEQKKNDKIGYRIQVFSDNNARTARNEARSKQRNIGARFPQHRTYVTYNAPYWRLRIGDFRTQEEAAEAAETLKKAFPAYAREIRVVRDRVNLPK